MPHLFDPLTLRGVTLRNRVGISPMCQYSATYGVANDWHLAHAGARAAGGAGLFVVEATAVEPRGRITPWDLGLWDDGQVEPLERVARFVREQGAVAAIQLGHAGRKGSRARPWEGDVPLSDADGGWDLVAPSPLRYSDADRVPAELSAEDLAGIVDAFESAAARAAAAGFAWVEVHAAHGYLLHSFLSPVTNRRTDDYGGTFENRVRLLMDVVRAIRLVWPDRGVVAVRLSCTDWLPEGGWTLDESAVLSGMLKDEGVDLIDCSSGGIAGKVKVPVGPAYQVPFAAEIRRRATLATAAVGLITTPEQADAIVRDGQADVVLIGRESLRSPSWPLHAARTLGHPFPPPPQYRRAYP